MATNDPSPLSGTSLLDLGLDEITVPDEGKDQWAEAGRVLVDRVGASMRQQREANERERRDRESRRPLSERYDYRFEQDESPSQEDRQQGL
ncbi:MULTISPECIES: hypothetical protein [Paenarthrobacter]|uniref:Uncharacterized protein n=1 Tax=Paenarthrobacter ureafaciens TaxID=37931 RepID=A0AAX3EFN4_PAEUR|nr:MULTISPECIES: hypothetical protein [Paenarthrobacter]NKR13339.1 hypothetical protein [Arthrobacter sp. M5]NKR14811.1 hypothetical protein [Arthrobacter sp. M6]OEH62366.1 hypothetical protein A5N13_01525 [Arthrobacter sp. D4]OEH62937.1 hypothetical protein A5N17_09765 [Arthrobacter sp. D2]MDO5865109.1 hypothetical protein [Paenarthrobacter sp. SD-2]